MLKKLFKFLNRERCQVIAALICVVVVVSGLCCQSKTRSIKDPTQRVTRLELMSEIQSFNAQIESRLTDLDRQDLVRKQLLDLFSLYSTTGQFNPAGIAPMLVTLLGVGAIADNVGKRRDITTLKNAGQAN
ncbi:hypothetical protein ES703_117911 [subsurface metagenome]